MIPPQSPPFTVHLHFRFLGLLYLTFNLIPPAFLGILCRLFNNPLNRSSYKMYANVNSRGRSSIVLHDYCGMDSLKGTMSLPLPEEGDHPLVKELRRVASWSNYLKSVGEEDNTDEEWGVDRSQLVITKKFASGMYSSLYHGFYKQRPVALKVMVNPEGDEVVAAKLEKEFAAEASFLFRLRHPNIIDFVAACKKPPVYCVITEYLSGGSLRSYLSKQEPHSLPLSLMLKMALDIAKGMQYLHSKGIIHRDLKSDNLLLDDSMHVKVADFGVSCFESQCSQAKKGCMGTIRWMAPEMIKEKLYTRKVDVYSFGIVLWELLTAQYPFHEMTLEQVGYAVSHKNARPELPTACPPGIAHLIKQCWATDPKKRPIFDQIVCLLEFFIASLRDDPTFLLYYKPIRQQKFFHRLKTCISLTGHGYVMD